MMFANLQRLRERTWPGTSVSPDAQTTAQRQAAALPVSGPAWRELTRIPYDSDARGFEDPFWSNSGGGAGNVGGLIEAIAVKGTTLFVAATAAASGVPPTTAHTGRRRRHAADAVGGIAGGRPRERLDLGRYRHS